MVLDVVRRDSNLLLKTRLISLRLYRVRIRSYQKGFSFDRFVQRKVVFLVLVLVCQMGFPLVWVRVSCCDVASLLHWVLPQCLVLRGVVLLVLVLVCQMGFPLVWVRVSCCDVASLLHWVLPQCLVLRGAVLLVWVLVSCCWCASLLCWVLPQRLCILVRIR